jgi:GNAT superfamily N-acetyltransferase
MPIDVLAVQSAAELEAFIDLPLEIYRGDPNWAPLPRRELKKKLDRMTYPFFEHGQAEFFVARRDGCVVGRIAAIKNDLHTATHHDDVGFFGFFECVDDQDVADALFTAAAGWLRSHGLQVMRGPLSYSTNEECGLLIEGFDSPPVIMMAYNPPYYARIIEAFGFRKAKDLLAYEATKDIVFPERALRLLELAKRELNITIRPFSRRFRRRDCATIRDIYHSVRGAGNWAFVPMTDREVDQLASELLRIGDPELVRIAEVDGGAVGFIVVLPDWNQALRLARSSRAPFYLLRTLWYSRRIDTARVLVFGVRAEYRLQGIDIMLCHEAHVAGIRKGYRRVEMSWVLEDNVVVNQALRKLGGRVYKRYRLYDLSLA